jgi:NADH-quinone oxidoreductase subunit A
MHFTDSRLPVVVAEADQPLKLSPAATGLYRELGIRSPELPTTTPVTLAEVPAVKNAPNEAQRITELVRAGGHQLAWVTTVDIIVFFAILLIGFAYVWRRGDLDWVRAVTRERAARDFKTRNYDPLDEEAAVAV